VEPEVGSTVDAVRLHRNRGGNITVANGEMARVPRRDKHNPTDLEELTSWAGLICLLGGLAVGIIAVGLMLAFCPPLDVRSLVLLLQSASTGA
jgi:hypothetical protein